MALIDVINELDDRSTFGTTLVLNDGNLRIAEGVAPDRIAIMGACSASESNSRGTDYLIPTGVPHRLATLQDLKYFENDDPDLTPSELLLAFEDSYNAGGRSFEMVIVTRTVAQLGDDIDDAATIVPVSTIYTNKLTATGVMGAHPTGNTNFSMFVHNNDIFVAGGERPDTPATGTIDHTLVDLADGDYMLFTHTDGTVHAFWFNFSGSAAEPAAVTAAVAAGTVGSTSTEVDISGDGGAEATEALTLAAAITAHATLPITAYSSGAGTTDLESDEAGTEGNNWTLTEAVVDAQFAVTGMAGGSATNTISRRIMVFDPATDTWSNAVNASGVAQRLVVARRDAGAVRESATQVNITGGMTTIKGGADTAVASVDDITFASAGSSVVSSVAAGTAINGALTTLGEAAWVLVGSVWYIIGGQTGTGTRSDMIATFVPSTGVATDTTVNLAAAARWMGAFYQSAHDRIYIFGGETASGALNTTQIYSVSGVAMLATPVAGNMSEAKYDMGFVGLNGAGWSFGGVNASGDSKRVERFDPDTLTWQRKSDLTTADSGGRAVTSSNHIFYVDGVQGNDYNVGLGNLSDQYVGFPSIYPFYIQIDWEIMSVTGVTTTRARGRDVDAFIVTRAQKGSTAVAHSDYTDVVEDPEALYDDLESAYEMMTDSSRADYVLPPMRAVADCPYLPLGQNFAYQAATYCYAKSLKDRAAMAVLAVFPPMEEPYETPTMAEKTTWVNSLIAFDRQNWLLEDIWKIGDGVTDSDGDKKADTYAFYATTDGEIPVGAPPVSAGTIKKDNNGAGVPIDIGKHLHIVYPYGFSTGANYRKKFPSASLGYLRSGAASFIGTLATLEPNIGSTNALVSAFEPWELLSFTQENRLNRRRYIGAVDPGDGSLRWNTGYTWAWNVDQFNRSDYVLGSTFRKSVAISRILRSILLRYYGKPVNGPHFNALQVDISEAITGAVEAGIVGPATDFEFRVSRADRILGRGVLILNAEFEGELTHVTLNVSQFVR